MKNMNKKMFIYLLVITGLLTYGLFLYHRSQPLDQARIDACEARVKDMPESTQEEINRSINTYMECLRQ